MQADGDGAATVGRQVVSMRPAALALSALFGLVALGAGGLWVAQGFPESALTSPDTLAAASAHALGERGGAPAARQYINRELAWGDSRPSAWCRLALADFNQSGRFDAKVDRNLMKSYDAAPFDTELFTWRLQFVFDNWQSVSPALRTRAMREARAFHAKWETRLVVESVIPRVRNPTGQFALRLAIRGAEPPAH